MLRKWFGQVIYAKREIILEQLEERIVFDAAVDSGAQDDSDQADSGSAQDETAGQESGDSVAGPEEASDAGTSSDTLDQVFDQNLDEILITNVTDLEQDSSESGPAVLVISSALQQADTLLAAAADGVITVLYDAANDTPEGLLSAIEAALDGQEASSIAFATHDLGEGGFYLTDEYSVDPGTLLGSDEMQAFWQGVGELVEDGGRIDILACDLASTEIGTFLIYQLEEISGQNVAASDDPTGNPANGGDWILETDDVDLETVYFSTEGLDGFTDTLAAEEILTPSDYGYYFGWSTAIYEDTIVVGAPYAYNYEFGIRDFGAVYVFVRDGATWTEQAILLPEDEDGEHTAAGGNYGDLGLMFGRSVDIYEDTVVVGAYGYDSEYDDDTGAVYIFTRSGEEWTQQGNPLVPADVENNDFIGFSVSIYEDTVVAGAPNSDTIVQGQETNSAGAAYIFTRSGEEWTLETKLTASDGEYCDKFGKSVAIYGDTVAVGAPGYDNFDLAAEDSRAYQLCPPDEDGGTGAVYVYVKTGDVWIEQSILEPSMESVPDDWLETEDVTSGCIFVMGHFGEHVCIYEDTIVTRIFSVAAIVFDRTDDIWTDQPYLVWPFDYDGMRWIWRFDIYENTLVCADVKAPHALYVFTGSDDNTWTLQEVVPKIYSDPHSDECWGAFGVSLYGGTAVVGHIDFNYDDGRGAIFVYEGNNRPSLDIGGDPTFTGIDRNAFNTSGDTVADLVVDGSITDPDVDAAPESIAVTAVDNTHGVWQYSIDNGATWLNFTDTTGEVVDLSASGGIRLLDGSLTGDATTRIRFVPDEDWCGEATIEYQAWDQSRGAENGTTFDSSAGECGWELPISYGTPETATLMVKEDNYAPVLDDIGDRILGTDTALTFTLSASDSNVYPVNVLTFSATDLPDGATLDGTTGVFNWTPAADQDGTYTVTFIVTDDGAGNLTDSETITIFVNDAPTLDTSGAATFATIEEDPVTNVGDTIADLVVDGSITDPNADPAPESIAVVQVDNTNGVWQFSTDNGATWADFTDITGQMVNLSGEARLLDGTLTGDDTTRIRFVPDEDWYGTATIEYQAWDMSDAAANGSTMDLSTFFDEHFSPVSNGMPETAEIMVIQQNDPPALDDVGDRIVGTEALLSFTLSASDSHDDPANNLTFSATGLPDGATLDGTTGVFNWTPAADQAGAYTVTFIVTDDGAGNLTDSETITIIVNDAPTLDTSANPAFTAIDENASNNPGDTVADLVVDGSITDPNADPAPESIAVTAVDNTNGVWQFSTDNGATWDDFTNVTGQVVDLSDEARLLDGTLTGDDTTRIRFVPDAEWYGDATIQYIAWDMSDGSANGSIEDLSVTGRGGATAFSAGAAETATIMVKEQNYAPELGDIGDKTIGTDTALTFTLSASDSNVYPVNVLTFSATGLPDGATLDGTTGFFDWTPAADQAGAYTVTFIVTDDGTGNLTDSETITIIVNDAPTLDTSGNPAFTAIDEDPVTNLGDTVEDLVVDGSITDPNADPAPESIAVAQVDNTNGVWQFSTDNGVTWANFTNITGQVVDLSGGARLLDGTLTGADTTRIRFVPDTDWHGDATIQYIAWDMSDGAANGSTVDLSVTGQGGATAFSAGAAETAGVTVNAVNDAPVVIAPGNVTLLEDTSVAITGITVSDIDAGAGQVQVSLSVDHGTLTLAGISGLTFDPAAGDGASNVIFEGTPADVNAALATLTYTVDEDYSGDDSVRITVNDQGNSGAGGEQTGAGAIGITVVDVPESDGSGKSYLGQFYDFTGGNGPEIGRFSLAGSMPEIGRLIDFLSSQGALPFSPLGGEGPHNSPEVVSQFGILLHEALFGEDTAGQEQAWNGLFTFVSGNKPEQGGDEWLDLDEFLGKLREWQFGKALNEILLIFNADEIKLVEWFNSLMSSADDWVGKQQAGAMEPGESIQQSLAMKTMVFDMNQLRMTDLFSEDLGGNGFANLQEPASTSGGPVCRVFDLREMSFVMALAG